MNITTLSVLITRCVSFLSQLVPTATVTKFLSIMLASITAFSTVGSASLTTTASATAIPKAVVITDFREKKGSTP